jgi:hypothetical protein
VAGGVAALEQERVGHNWPIELQLLLHRRKTMTHVYRISKGPDVVDILDSIESIETFGCKQGPGRYDVDEHVL